MVFPSQNTTVDFFYICFVTLLVFLFFFPYSLPRIPLPKKKKKFLKHSAQTFISSNRAHGLQQTMQEKHLYISHLA